MKKRKVKAWACIIGGVIHKIFLDRTKIDWTMFSPDEIQEVEISFVVKQKK